jgi:hypothetical protein
MSASAPDPLSGTLLAEADYVQLSRLVIEAAWRVDFGRSETLHELFVDDGQLDLGPGQPILRGREEIREWGSKLEAAHPYGRIRHVCGNMRFVADGDDAAHGTTVLTVYMEEGDGLGTTLPWTVGEDRDHFVRTDQGWRLVFRQWVGLFVR